ncbi:MAG: heavy metal-responsive transcriptional regulator [Caldilineales bacterium]|nr:heavy metal-responsive transcriptional regulator [Caldilineales bacterium]
MQIKDLAERTGVSTKTIRYYQEIGVLPPPKRLPNGYRDYSQADVDRLKLVAGAPGLGFSLDDIGEIMDMRERREAPCRTVLDLMAEKADEIAGRIAALQRLETDLRQLHRFGLTFPTDDVDGKNCICHLVSERTPVSIEQGKMKVR